MAAGLGFKNFTTGEVLTAADVNGYLMQGVLVFASEAARNAAITSPQEGQFAYTKDNNSLWYYTGSAWAASGATGDIEGVTAGTGISGGGTSGTVTITNSMATEITAKADLIVGTGNAAFDNLAVGANGTVLTADSTVSPTGLKWATPAGGSSGLNLIATDSFSGVSSITKDSLFSTTYDNYRILIEFTATATASFNFYFRDGGSNITSGYARQTLGSAGSTVNAARTTSSGEGTVANSLSTGRNFIVFDIASPFLSQRKGVITEALCTYDTVINERYMNISDSTASCTGIYLFPNTGNITGKVSYYGYGK